MTLRSRLNPEEQRGQIERATTYRTGPNQHELECGFCGATYYVDEAIFDRVSSAIEQGFDNPFCCDDCESEYEELSH